MFLYSLDVVRATDLEIAKTVVIAIVQIFDENCKFCRTDRRNVFVLDKCVKDKESVIFLRTFKILSSSWSSTE